MFTLFFTIAADNEIMSNKLFQFWFSSDKRMTAVAIIKERERKSPRSCMSRRNGKEYFVENGNISLNCSESLLIENNWKHCHCGKMRNYSWWAISSFVTMFSNVICQMYVGKGLYLWLFDVLTWNRKKVLYNVCVSSR